MNLRNLLFVFVLIFFGKILPHPENMTPAHSICLLLGCYFPTRIMLVTLLFSYGLADMWIAWVQGFPLWGSWTFYTYSGMLGLVFLGTKIKQPLSMLLPMTLLGSVGFWLWSNFGVWLHSGMYFKTFSGFITCYIAAIPFLQKMLVGNLLWGVIIGSILSYMKKTSLPLVNTIKKRSPSFC